MYQAPEDKDALRNRVGVSYRSKNKARKKRSFSVAVILIDACRSIIFMALWCPSACSFAFYFWTPLLMTIRFPDVSAEIYVQCLYTHMC